MTTSSSSSSSSLSELRALKRQMEQALRKEERIHKHLEETVWQQQERRHKHEHEDDDDHGLFSSSHPVGAALAGQSTLARDTLTLTETWSAWRCSQEHAVVQHISPDNSRLSQTWTVRLVHRRFPAHPLELTFNSTSSADDHDHRFARVEHLRLRPLNLNEDAADPAPALVQPAELQPLLDDVERHADFHMALRGLATYLHTSEQRRTQLRQESEHVRVDVTAERAPGLSVTVVGHESRGNLARMWWGLAYSRRTLDFEEQHRVQFTKEGVQAANECSFPKELFKTGKCDNWSAIECFKNLSQMARLDTTPTPPTPTNTAGSTQKRTSRRSSKKTND